ncbi:unnamed protein product [Closterium sp. NIES-64]|nr:unnamed protein product [Closterium sp. NIES-64]
MQDKEMVVGVTGGDAADSLGEKEEGSVNVGGNDGDNDASLSSQQRHQQEELVGNPVGRLKIYVYDLPRDFNYNFIKKQPRCLTHMFALEVLFHRYILNSPVRTTNPDEADWFYMPVYPTCDLTASGLPLPFRSPRMIRAAITLVSERWPYWNRTDGADHFFITPHDFGACFHYEEEKAVTRGIVPLLKRATLVQTFGQSHHVCHKLLALCPSLLPSYDPPQEEKAITRGIVPLLKRATLVQTFGQSHHVCHKLLALCPSLLPSYDPPQEEKAITRGIMPLLKRATLVQTFGQSHHVCHKLLALCPSLLPSYDPPQEEKAITRGIMPLLKRATLVQTFGQSHHVCHKLLALCPSLLPSYDPPQEEKAITRGIVPLLKRATLVQTFGQSHRMCHKLLALCPSLLPSYDPPQEEKAITRGIVPLLKRATLEEKAITRGIMTLLKRATLVQTFGQSHHVCHKLLALCPPLLPSYDPPQEEKAITRGIMPLLKRATLVQTFGQSHHVCHKLLALCPSLLPSYDPPQEEKAITRGIMPLLKRATLVQTFGQSHHVCHKPGSIVVPPFAPTGHMHRRRIPPDTPRSIFVYFRGLFYDRNNDPQGGYYARGARASMWENFKSNPLFDMSAEHPASYYEDMQRSLFCLCPLGWAPWSPRLVESVFFGCIPVIVADNIVLPFSDVIPWREIAVFVPEKDVPKLDEILAGIGPRRVLAMQQRLASHAIRQAVVLGHPQPQEGDVFHQVLNGLARKLPHPPSTYLQAGDERLNWTAGPANDFKPWKPDSHVYW